MESLARLGLRCPKSRPEGGHLEQRRLPVPDDAPQSIGFRWVKGAARTRLRETTDARHVYDHPQRDEEVLHGECTLCFRARFPPYLLGQSYACRLRDRAQVSGRSPPLHVLRERPVQQGGGSWIDHLVSSDVVPERRPWIGVTEQRSRELDTRAIVDGSCRRAAEHVRRHTLDAGQIEDMTKLPPHVVGRQRRAVSARKHEDIIINMTALSQTHPKCLGRE